MKLWVVSILLIEPVSLFAFQAHGFCQGSLSRVPRFRGLCGNEQNSGKPVIGCKQTFTSKHAQRHSRGVRLALRSKVREADVVDSMLAKLYTWFGYETYGADGYCTSDAENMEIDAITGGNASMYGEITPHGFRTLASQINLSASDVFYDLGSGVGRSVLQAHLEWGVRGAVGVELAPSRHQRAVQALADMEAMEAVEDKWHRSFGVGVSEPADGGSGRGDGATATVSTEGRLSAERAGRRVAFYNDNMLECDISTATVIWCSALLFSPEFMGRLGRKLTEEGPDIRAVVSLQEFPDEALPRHVLAGGRPGPDLRPGDSESACHHGVEMTWAKGQASRIYLYTRTPH